MQTKLNRELTTEEGIIDNSLLKVDLTKELGRGGFGVVYKGKYRGKDAAVKELLIKDFSSSAQQEFESESKIMLQLRDPSVVHLYGVTREKPYRMVLEHCSLGSLDKYLHSKKREEVSWELRFHLATGIASGVQYLHTYNPIIIHGDLKSLNVLLTGDPLRPDTKIADFGMSKLKTETQSKTKDSRADKGWSIQWAAPELFSLSPKKTAASDMYAFGITLWEIVSHDYPYRNVTADMIQVLIKSGERAEVPENTPPLFAKVMTDCWKQKPTDRPSAKAVLEHLQAYEETVEVESIEASSGSTSPSVLSGGPLKSSSSSNGSNNSPVVSQFLNSSLPDVAPKGEVFSGSSENTTRSSTVATTTNSSSKSNQARLTYSQQVEEASKAIQSKIDTNEFSTLLRWVAEGHLVQVEKALNKTPILTLGRGTLVDLSGRMFNNITLLQYAVWAWDREMCELIMRYLGAQDSGIQLKAWFENHAHYSPYGLYYDIQPLITKTKIYCENYTKWSDKECREYWQKEVGGEQRNCPAWLVYMWCESGKDTAWRKKDFSSKVKREYNKNWLQWWFTGNDHGGCGVGTTWAAVGGSAPLYDLKHLGTTTANTMEDGLFRTRISSYVSYDLRCQEQLAQEEEQFLADLKARIFASTTESSTTATTTALSSSSFNSERGGSRSRRHAVTSPLIFNLSSVLDVDPPLLTSKVQLLEAWLKGDVGLVRELESQGASLLNPNQKTLKYSQQVEATSKAIQDKINLQELAALLKWVTEGNLVEIEERLKKTPLLALGAGRVTDLSDRTFNNITILQYAAWALDAEMCELIINYVGIHNSAIQLKALTEEADYYSVHGASYSVLPLVTKYQMYLANYTNWGDNECDRYWQREIGGEQRNCPAWLIYAWTEEGKNVAWVKQDMNCKIKREYDKEHLKWWFIEKYNDRGSGVGSTWAAWRGDRTSQSAGEGKSEVALKFLTNVLVWWVVPVQLDQKCVSRLAKSREERLQQLMVKVTQLNQNRLPNLSEITSVDVNAVSLSFQPLSFSSSISSSQVSYMPVFIPLAKSNSKTINPQQQTTQDELISELYKGDLETVKKFESEGASFLHPNKEGEYPLLAAVYSANFELVHYMEERLKESAKMQWEHIDPIKAKEKIEAAKPTETNNINTVGDLGRWYGKYKGSGWEEFYNREALKKENCQVWSQEWETMEERASKMGTKWEMLIRKMDNVTTDRLTHGKHIELHTNKLNKLIGGKSNKPVERGLFYPGVSTHTEVVKMICEQLDQLKKEVEIKAIKQSISTASTTTSTSSTAEHRSPTPY